ncbi:MAG: hypothetical protein AAGI30_13475 [Planctomycetota bacterium]
MTIIQRDNPAELAIGIFEMDSKILDVARVVSHCGVGPVLGGIAVFLHGYRRSTEDVDLYMVDPKTTRAKLDAVGAVWDDENREFVLDGVAIHVIDQRVTGSEFTHVSEIDGIRVVGLADLVRFKLHSGLNQAHRVKDIADVVELARAIPLDKSFVTKLPKEQRAAFKKLIDSLGRAPKYADRLDPDDPGDDS